MARQNPPIPQFHTLDSVQCEKLLKRHVVGRLAFALHDRVEIVPVHFVFSDGWIYGRTSPGEKLLTLLRNRSVAFEVDEYSGLFSWQSVVVHGSFYLLERGEDKLDTTYDHAMSVLRRLSPGTLTESDPVPFRTQPFRINVSKMSGRGAKPEGGSIQEPTAEHMVDTTTPEADVLLHRRVAAVAAGILGANSHLVNITASDGVVILTGSAESAAQKRSLEKAIGGIGGVTAIVQQLDTLWPAKAHRTPVELARTAVAALRSETPSAKGITLVIDNDWVRAEGTLASPADAQDVIRALDSVPGSRGVINRLAIG